MKRVQLFLLLCVFALASCAKQPAPSAPPQAEPVTQTPAPRALGGLSVTFQVQDGEAQADTQQLQATLQGHLTPQATQAPLNFSSNPLSKGLIDKDGFRYLYAVFEAENTGTETFSNVDLFATYVPSNSLAGSAVAGLKDALGWAIADPQIARSITPTHRMQDDSGRLSVKPDEADFQAFTPDQVLDAQSALPAFLGNLDLLDYGYTLRSANGTRSLAPGAKGLVSFAIKFPFDPAASAEFPFSFVLNYQAFETSLVQVTRSVEEANNSVAAACTRATTVNASRVITLGNTSYPNVPNCNAVALQDIKLAVAVNDLPAKYLLGTGEDTAPPSTPTNLSATAGNEEVSLSWNASPSPDTAGYLLYRDGTEVYSGTLTSYTDADLTNGTPYSYQVAAFDSAGNVSAISAAVTATPEAPTAIDVKVNFNAEDGEQPSGYLLDFGQAYGLRTRADQASSTYSYGWVEAADGTTPLDLSGGQRGNGRDRGTSQTDQRLNTLVHMQADDIVADGDSFSGVAVEGVWEIAVPNGTYQVTVAAGDPNANDYAKDPEVHAINVEGVQAIAPFAPPGTVGADAQHRTATLNVTVNDGKLTVDADGGTNTKIDYIDILTTDPSSGTPDGSVSPAELIYSGIKNSTSAAKSSPSSITVTNTGDGALTLSGSSFTGTNPGAFTLTTSLPLTVSANGSAALNVQFTPGNATGALSAVLELSTDDPTNPTLTANLYGLGAVGFGGSKEPTFQAAMDTLGYGIDVGGTTLILGTNPAPIGDEVAVSLFEKAGAGNVTMLPVARYSPDERLPYGYYLPNDNTPTLNEVGAIDTNGNASGTYDADWEQTLFPKPEAGSSLSFDPGSAAFGIYVDSLTFNRVSYTEDDLNTGTPHAARVYPAKDRSGQALANTYIVAFEDASNGDYQDYVFVLGNVKPATPVQAQTCSPISTLECAQVGVALPYTLSWSADEGGMTDGAGVGTGFTMVDPPSARLAADAPVFNADVPGYEPSKLAVNAAAGTLQVSSTQGIQYAQPAGQGSPNSTDTNSQINALGVGLDASSQKVRFETTFTPPTFPSKNDSQQGGLWFGLDENNYIKLVYGNNGNGNAQVQLLLETDASGTLTYQGDAVDLKSGTFSQSGVSTVTLSLEVDPVTGLAQGFYALNSGAATLVASNGNDTVALPTSFFAGTDHDQAGATAPLSYGGVFTTHRRAAADASLTFRFESFSVTPLAGDTTDPTVTVELSGTQDGADYVGDVTITVTASDDTSVSSTEVSVDGGAFQPYSGPFVVSGAGSHTVEARATDPSGNTGTAQTSFSIVTAYQGGTVALENRDWQFPSSVTEAGRAHFDSWLAFNRHQSNRSAADADFGQHDLATLRIKNTSGSEDLQLFSLSFRDNTDNNTNSPAFALPNGEEALSAPIVITPGSFYDLDVAFVYDRNTSARNENVFAELVVSSSDPATSEATVQLGGSWQRQREGGNEPNVAQVVSAFGFETNIVNPGQQINNQGRIEAIGEEVLAPFWQRADTSEPIYVRQLAAYHSCCPNTATFMVQQNIGSGSTTNILTHEGDDGQAFLPRKNNTNGPAQTTFTPSNTFFGFKIDPEFSDWDRNRQPTSTDEGHHLRLWPARDLNGDLIPNSYLVVMDYAGINYDFNDNVYFVSNLQPVPNTEWRNKVPVDIAITQDAPALGTVGEDLTVSFTVTNRRSYFAAYDVSLSSPLPANATFVSASAGCTESGGTVSCDLGDIATGASKTVDITLQPTAAGELVTTAEASVFGLIVEPGVSTSSGTLRVDASATVTVDDGSTTITEIARYNFQAAGAPVPNGFTADTGAAYGVRNGQTYGWLDASGPVDASSNARDRDRSGITQERDTFMHLAYGDCCPTSNNGLQQDVYWEHELPSGSYRVTLSFGDQPGGSNGYDSQHQVSVEGTLAPSGPFQATSAEEYREVVVQVEVTDGVLTIASVDERFQHQTELRHH